MASTVYDPEICFAARVHGFATETKAVARPKSRQLRRLEINGLENHSILYLKGVKQTTSIVTSIYFSFKTIFFTYNAQ